MTVGRKSRSIKKVVGILSDPHPELVSLVSYPASQTPWKVIKSEDPTALRAKKAELATRAASSVVDIHEVVFSKSAFKTSEAVKGYLDDNGYENFQINESGDFWIVPGRAKEDLEDGLEDIAIGKGIKMTLGRLRPARKSEQQTAAPEQDQTRSTKSIYSISDFASVLSTISYLLSDAQYEAEYRGDNSTLPDQLKAWLLSGVTVFENLATNEVEKLVERINAQKSDLERKRRSETNTTQESTVTTQTPATETTQTAPATPPAVVTTPETPAAPAANTETTPAPTAAPAATVEANPATATQPAPAATTTTETPPATPATAEQTPAAPAAPAPTTPAVEELTDEEKAAKAADPIGFAVSRAMGKVGESVAKAMTSALEPVNASLTELREQVTKSTQRLDVVETATRQVRQSGDNAEVSAPSTQAAPQQDEKARKHQERLNRDRLGF